MRIGPLPSANARGWRGAPLAALVAFLLLAVGLAMPAMGLAGTITVNAAGLRDTANNTATGYATSLSGVQFQYSNNNGPWTNFSTLTNASGVAVSQDLPQGSNYRVRMAPGQSVGVFGDLQQISYGVAFNSVGVPRDYFWFGQVPDVGNVTATPNRPEGATGGLTQTNNRFVLRRANPALAATCGDLRLVLSFDVSGSILENATLRTAFRNASVSFLTDLRDSAANVKVRLDYFATQSSGVGQVYDLTVPAQFTAAINFVNNSLYNDNVRPAPIAGSDTAGSYTNWDAALQTAALEGSSPATVPGFTSNGVIFLTDGNPTMGQGLSISSTVQYSHVSYAIASANNVKNLGKRLIAVGAGDVNATNLSAISGPNQGTDYFAGDVDSLGPALAQLAGQLCGADIFVRKYVDDAPSEPQAGWEFTLAKQDPTDTSFTIAPPSATTAGSPAQTQFIVGSLPVNFDTRTVLLNEVIADPGYDFGNVKCQAESFPTYADTIAVDPPGQQQQALAVKRDDDIYCTYVNTRKTVDVIVTKKVLGRSDDDGLGGVTFPIFFNGQEVVASGSDPATGLTDGDQSDPFTVPVGDPFTVAEDLDELDERFAFLSITCRQGANVLQAGENGYTPTKTKNITCKVRNEVRPTVTVEKIVIGADNDPTPFGATLTSPGDPDPTVVETYSVSEAGGPSDPPTLLDSGTLYTLNEDTPVPAGYEHQSTVCTKVQQEIEVLEVVLEDNQFEPQAGESYRCVITNVKLPTLRVIKNVINNNGGTAGPSAFTMQVSVNGGAPSQFPGAAAPGTTVPLQVGDTFAVSEQVAAGYQQTGTAGICTLNGEGAVPGGEYVCTITNDDIAPQLTVIKVVDNSAGGTLGPAAFTMNVAGTNVSQPSFPGASAPGTTVTLNAGAYSVSEVIPAESNYTQTSAVGCVGNLAIGQSATCTITNTFVPPTITTTETPPPPPPAEVAGVVTPPPPRVITPPRVTQVQRTRLAITKTAPARARVGARFVYTIRVRNAGANVARNVVLRDPLPAGIVALRAVPRRGVTVRGRVVVAQLGNMRPGQVRMVRVVVRSTPRVRGVRTNVATARGSNTALVRARARTAFIVPAPRAIIPRVTG